MLTSSDNKCRNCDRNLRQSARADREEVEVELADLKQNSVAAIAEFPEPVDLLNRLKARRKKSRADLGDVETLLEILGSES
ncbi:hypothetical protein QUA82_19195 [Microcoleus sp. F8-D3]